MSNNKNELPTVEFTDRGRELTVDGGSAPLPDDLVQILTEPGVAKAPSGPKK